MEKNVATLHMTAKSPTAPIASPKVVRLRHPAPKPNAAENDTALDIARDHASDCRFVTAGADLFAEGESSDNLYIVLSGWLFLHRILEDGRRQILDFVLPGGVLGFRARHSTPFPCTAEALTDAKVAVIPLSRVSDRPGCAMALLSAANEALLEAFDNLTDLGRRTARESVAHFLLRMDRRTRLAMKSNEDGSLPFPLTQEHMGDALGLTAVHVCRTLRALREEGLVQVGRGRLSILDRDALALEAGAFSPDLRDARMAS
jgi:CRP/FNR family transcriptional regulator